MLLINIHNSFFLKGSSTVTMPLPLSPVNIPITAEQLEGIVAASRLYRPDHEVPVLPTLVPRPHTRKRGRDDTEHDPPPPPHTSQSGSKRARSTPSTPPRRPTTRSQSTQLSEEEKRAIIKAAAIGIEGTSAISIHNIVSQRFRIPQFIKDIGTHAVTFYFDEHRRMITGHNDAITYKKSY